MACREVGKWRNIGNTMSATAFTDDHIELLAGRHRHDASRVPTTTAVCIAAVATATTTGTDRMHDNRRDPTRYRPCLHRAVERERREYSAILEHDATVTTDGVGT
jgi:hypothetical protein